jgi:hypothetical protein
MRAIDPLQVDGAGVESFKQAGQTGADRSPRSAVETRPKPIRPRRTRAVQGQQRLFDLLGRKGPNKGVAVHPGAAAVEAGDVETPGRGGAAPKAVEVEGVEKTHTRRTLEETEG